MRTQTEYEEWHLHNEHVPRIMPSPEWERKMRDLRAIENRLDHMAPGPEFDRLDEISTALCRELGL